MRTMLPLPEHRPPRASVWQGAEALHGAHTMQHLCPVPPPCQPLTTARVAKVAQNRLVQACGET